MIVFDRSRITAMEHCPRQRYWQYHHLGTGIERTKLDIDLEVGITTHAIMASIFGDIVNHRYSDEWVRQHIAYQLSIFYNRVKSRGLSLDVASGYEQDDEGNIIAQPGVLDFLIQVYSSWIYMSVNAWVSCNSGLNSLVMEYEVVNAEQEEELLMAEGEMLLLARPDALLRRHGDGELFILNFKTVGEPNQWWQEQWPLDQQTLTEVLAVEARIGQKVSGVIIEGMVKGGKRLQYPAGSGQWWINSPLVWGWKKAGAAPFPAEYAAKFEWTDAEGHGHKLGKGWQKQPMFEDAMGLDGWLEWLKEHEPEVLEKQFVRLPPILRTQEAVDRWIRTNETREYGVQVALDCLNDDTNNYTLDDTFPMHTSGGNCIRPGRCSCFDLCHGTASLDPLSNGYQIRQCNHPKENEFIQQSSEVE